MQDCSQIKYSLTDLEVHGRWISWKKLLSEKGLTSNAACEIALEMKYVLEQERKTTRWQNGMDKVHDTTKQKAFLKTPLS